MGHTQNAISDIISEELKVPVRITRKILQRFLDIIADDIVYTGKITIRGLGSFYVTLRPPIHTTHPGTGAPILIPQKKVMRFRASASIKKRLNPATSVRARKAPRVKKPRKRRA
jgi:nucleoid DNA-binding protein